MAKKLVPIFVLLLILGGLYFLAKKYNLSSRSPQMSIAQDQPTSKIMPTVKATDSAKAVQIVQKFYNTYTNCLENPPKGIAQNVTEYCEMHNEFASVDLDKNVSKSGLLGKGVDPILCSQTPPQSTQVLDATPFASGSTSAEVVETYGAGSTVNIQAELVEENGNLKVSNITCPAF